MSDTPAADSPDRPAAAGPPLLYAPIDVRSTALAVLAVLGIIGFLYLARTVFIPVTLAVLMSYALTPVVDWLKRRARLPKAVGAAVTLALVLVGLALGVESLKPGAVELLDSVPRAAAKLNAALRRNLQGHPGAIDKMRAAANELEQTANAVTSTTPAVPQASTAHATARAPVGPALDIRDYLVMGTAGAATGLGQLVVVLALVFFLLTAGDRFRRTLVRSSGKTLSKKKLTVRILDEIVSQIQRYLLVQVATSALVGVMTGALFAAFGLAHALFWGCVAGVLHLIPYVGPTALVVITAAVAYVQFDSLRPVAYLTASTLAVVGVIGMLLVPWLTQRVGRLNAITVFISLLFWGWLWGVWGLLLGVPIVMAINAVCERVDELQPISEFLGSDAPAPTPAEAAAPTDA